MSQWTAILVLVVCAVMAVAWVWSMIRVAQRWHDPKFWAKYKSGLVGAYGESVGTRLSWAFPQGLYTLVPWLMIAVALVSPQLMRYATGAGEVELSYGVAITAVVCFVMIFASMALLGVLACFGKPRRLIPPALRR